MISLELARRLRENGLRWTPASGDRFVILQPDLEGQVFTVSEMTIEAHEDRNGTVLGFNGTTEWALDSVTLDGTLWLPREDQLREALGGTFRSLRRTDGGYRVEVALPGAGLVHLDAATAEDAYGKALVALVGQATSAA